MADSLPDSRGGGEAGTAGVVGAKTDGLPVLPCGEGTQVQQKEEAALNQSADAAHSSDQQNVFGGISVHPAGVGSVLPAVMEKEDTDMQQNECGVSVCPARVGSVVPPGKESMDTESLVVVQNDSESTEGDSSKTQGGLIQGSNESVLALVNTAPGGKGSEDTGNQVVVHNSSENASSESSKTQSELKLIQASDESKLEKVSVSQAKDPPDRDSSHVTQEAAVTGVGEPPTTVAAVSVSTKLPESLLTPPDNKSNLPGPEQPAPGPPALERPASGLPAPPEAALSTEDVSEGPAVSAACGGTLAGHCHSAIEDLSQPQSISTEQPPSLGLDSLRTASSGGPLEASATAQASPKASVPLLTPEAARAEGISSQSSHLSSMPLGSDSWAAGGIGVLSSSAPQETGATVAVSLSQSEGGGESESQVPVSEGPCLEECLSTESKRQTDITGGNACVVTDGEKNRTERKAKDMLENVTGQSDAPVEPVNNWNDRNFTCEAGTETETLPLIVATHSLSHEQNAEKEPGEAMESAAAAEVNGSRKKIVPLLDSEPLRPVTIGSSLQPLEEVQEATAAEEASSFTTDLAIIDSSADEADSIGGLVINNVIGAADGVVDFQPDEVEAEKELMDISSSAPQLSDTTEEHGPSAKRRRLENGPSGGEDKTDGAKKVILKVIPVKNGHGVWDSQKLQEVLLAKGTILLQIHASKEGLELYEADKTDTEKKVDFTAIMAVAKDDDHDSSLSCGSGGGDPEVDDPLAIGSSSSETTTHPSYGRSFPPSRGRSTALQPAMPPRPTFKHLQTPQHYYLKNEVLGLPPPLEFEEPQGGSADMSGVGAKSKSTAIRHVYLGLHGMDKTRECKVCGVHYWHPREEKLHLHNEMYMCDKCPFATRTCQAFTKHIMTHKTKQQKCTVCFEVFTSPITHAVHKRKIHGLYDCKHCAAELPSKSEWSSHMKQKHKDKCKGSTEEKVTQIMVNTSEKVPNSAQSTAGKPSSQVYQSHLRTRLMEGRRQSLVHILPKQTTPNKDFIPNITQASDESSSSNKHLLVRNMAMIAPNSSAGMIISASEAMGIIKTSSVQALSSLVPSQLPYTLTKASDFDVNSSGSSVSSASNQTTFTSSTPTDMDGITLKEEPLDEENAKPNTVLIKAKPKGKRGPKGNQVLMLPCESCSAVFKNLTALRIHIKQKHTVKPKCPLCNITKPSARKVYQHQATVHKDKLRCHHYCLALFDTREELSAHHINVHNKDDTVMKCRYCRESYPRGTYLKHLEKCTGEIKNKLIKLCTCGKKFTDFPEYLEHVENCESVGEKKDGGGGSPTTSTAKDKDSTVPESEKEVNSESIGRSPILEPQEASSTTDGSKIVKCRSCRKIFSNEEKGIDHVIRQHKAALAYMKEYRICDICGKLFVLGLALCKHLLEHYERDGMWDKIIPSHFIMDYTKVKCWVCKTQGVSYSEYHIENRNAAIDRIFSSQAYKDSVTDENDSSYCCLCEESFTDKQNFWNHIKIHLSKSLTSNTEESLYMFCPKCDYKCSTRSELVEHVAIHFILQKKDETLKSKSTLARTDDKSSCETEVHGERHGRAAFECKLCQIMFDIKSEALSHVFDNHKKVLEETITFKNCPLCDKSFFKPASLCSHILNHYADHGMWEKMVPRDLLSQVSNDSDKRYCWICKCTFSYKSQHHQAKRNAQIEKSLLAKSEELDEEKQIQCPLCEFSCSNRYAHWKHIKLHLYLNRKSLGKLDPEPEPELPANTEDLEKKKFDCLRCNKHFYGMEELRKHLAMHFLRPYKARKRKALQAVVESKTVAKKVKTMTLRSKSQRSKCNNVKCVTCRKTFRYSTDAVAHVMSIHKGKMTGSRVNNLQCRLCNVGFKSEWWLCRHMLNHYSGMEMWDALVPRDLASKLNARNKCWVCKCMLNKNYTAHTSKRNSYISVLLAAKCKLKEIPFDCSLCNQEFPTRLEYWQHMMLHLCTPPLQCAPEIESVCQNKGEENKCPCCSVYFPNEEALDEHLPLHFLEYEAEFQAESRLMTENQLSEDDMARTGDSSSSEDDEWLPPSLLKKKKLEQKEEEGMSESNSSEDNKESNKDAVGNDGMSVDLTKDNDNSSHSGAEKPTG